LGVILEAVEKQIPPPVEQVPQAPPPIVENSNRNFWKYLGIGLSIVSFCIAIAVGGYLYVASKNAPVKTACTMEAKLCPDGTSVGRTGPKCEFSPCPTVTPTPDPTASWKTYTNTTYGFSLKYPAAFIKSAMEESWSPPDQSFTIAISYVKTLPFYAKTLSDDNITVSGQIVRKLVGQEIISDTGTVIQVGPLQSRGNYFIISYSSGAKKADPKDIDTFNQILSTFKFTQ